MKTLIFITLITLLPGCLFFDSSTSTCEDTAKCSSDEVYGEFVRYRNECSWSSSSPECVDGNCEDQYMECRNFIEFSLENPGLKTVTISEPTQLKLHYSNGMPPRVVDLDGVGYYSTTEGEKGIVAQNPTVKQVLELEPDESVTLTLSFFMQPNEPVAAKAQVTFDIGDQDALTLTTNIIKFGNSLPPGNEILEQSQN